VRKLRRSPDSFLSPQFLHTHSLLRIQTLKSFNKHKVSKMRNNVTHQRIAMALFFAMSLSATFASAKPDDNQDRERRGPPPEAFEACANLSEDAACSFQGRRGDLEGICIIPRHDDEALVCAPAGGPPDDRAEKEPRAI